MTTRRHNAAGEFTFDARDDDVTRARKFTSTEKNDRWEQELTGGLKPIAQPQPTGQSHHSSTGRMSIGSSRNFPERRTAGKA